MVEEKVMIAALSKDLTEVEHLLNQMTIRELVDLKEAAQEIVDRAATTQDIKRKLRGIADEA